MLNALKSKHTVPLLLRQSPKLFSTEAAAEQSSEHPFLQNPNTFYAKLSGITKHALKTDFINLLEESNLTPDDIKVSCTRELKSVLCFVRMVQFPSRAALDNAFKTITKKGRLFKLERADRSHWDLLMPYDGRTLLFQGIPQNALPEDVARFLSSCEYGDSSMQLFLRQGFPGPAKIASDFGS